MKRLQKILKMAAFSVVTTGLALPTLANAATDASKEWVQKAYVAYYGRPADPGGLEYWANRMDAEGGSLASIIGEFGNSVEFTRRYGRLTNTELVTKIYRQTLSRDPDAAGLAWYIGELEAGRKTLQSITLDIIGGANLPPDSTTVSNKLRIADYYTMRVVGGCPYGDESNGFAATQNVTMEVDTVYSTRAAVDRYCAGNGTNALVGVALNASTRYATIGDSITLSWSSTNATSCVAGGAWEGALDSSAVKTVLPSLEGTATFSVSCANNGLSSTAAVTIAIAPRYLPAATIPDDKLRLTRIDLRYDSPSDSYNLSGHQVTSFAAMKPLIDQIKRVGYNGVVINLQTPINKNTGKIGLNDVPGVNKDLPRDYERIIKYAKDQSLKVWLSLLIVDSVNDVTNDFDFSKFTERSMFDNIIAYQKAIAIGAERLGVDGIIISEGNWTFDTQEHISYWIDLIKELRAVFSGKLSYMQSFGQSATPIWQYVDYATYFLNEPLSRTPQSDLKTVVELYSNTANGFNLIETLRRFKKESGKQLILFLMPMATDEGVGILPSNFFDMMINSTWNSAVYESLKKYVSYETQQIKIRAFLEVLGRDLIDVTDGIAIDGYAPWLGDVNFAKPDNPVYLYYCCAFNLTYNPGAEKVINSYFSKPWGYHILQ